MAGTGGGLDVGPVTGGPEDGTSSGGASGGETSLTPAQSLHADILREITALTETPKQLTHAIIKKIRDYDALVAKALLDIANSGSPVSTSDLDAYSAQVLQIQAAVGKTSVGATGVWLDLEETNTFIAKIKSGTLSDLKGKLAAKAAAAPATVAPATLTPAAGASVTGGSTAASLSQATTPPGPSDDEIEDEGASKKPKEFTIKPLNLFTDANGNPTTIGQVLMQFFNLMLVSMFAHAFVVRPLSVLFAGAAGISATLGGIVAKGIGLGIYVGALGFDKFLPGYINPEHYKNNYFNKLGDSGLAYGKKTDRALNAVWHLGGTTLSLTGLVLASPSWVLNKTVFRASLKAKRQEIDADIEDDPEYKRLAASIDAKHASNPDKTARDAELATARKRLVNQRLYPKTTTLQRTLKISAVELSGDAFNNVFTNSIALFMPMHARNALFAVGEFALGAASLPFAIVGSSVVAFGKKLGFKDSATAFQENIAEPLNGFVGNRFLAGLGRIGEILGNPLVGLMPSALGEGARRMMINWYGNTNDNIAHQALLHLEEGSAWHDAILRRAPNTYFLISTMEHAPNRILNLAATPVFYPLGGFTGVVNLGARALRWFAKLFTADTPNLNMVVNASGMLTGSLIADTTRLIITGKAEDRQNPFALVPIGVRKAAQAKARELFDQTSGFVSGNWNKNPSNPLMSMEAASPAITPSSSSSNLSSQGTSTIPPSPPPPGGVNAGLSTSGDSSSAIGAGLTSANSTATSGTNLDQPAIVADLNVTRKEPSVSQSTEERAGNIRNFFARNMSVPFRNISLPTKAGMYRRMEYARSFLVRNVSLSFYRAKSPAPDIAEGGSSPTNNTNTPSSV